MTEYDLIQAMSGVDEFGDGKCVVAIKLQRCDAEGHVVDIDEEFISEKPVVEIFQQPGGYVSVDLCFQSIEDVDLKVVFAYLDRFFSASNSASDRDGSFPLMTVSFFPRALGGAFWAIGLNPVFYALTPEDSTGEPRIIRMVFVAQEDTDALPNFLFLASPEPQLESLGFQPEGEIGAGAFIS